MGYVNPAGATPTTVFGSPSIAIERPTIARVAAELRLPDVVARDDDARVRRLFVGRKPRPSAGGTPRRSNRSHDDHHARRAGPAVAAGQRHADIPIAGDPLEHAARRSSKNVK